MRVELGVAEFHQPRPIRPQEDAPHRPTRIDLAEDLAVGRHLPQVECRDGVGGFGGILIFGMDWAPPAATWRSFELMAEYVRPRLSGANDARQASYQFAKANQSENRIKVRGAIQTATEKFEAETGQAVIRRAEFGDK